MSNLKKILSAVFVLLAFSSFGQHTPLTLKAAIQRSLEVSKILKNEQTSILLAKSREISVRDARLPEINASGQVLYLPFAPTVDLKYQQNNAAQPSAEPAAAAFPTPHVVAFGSLAISEPIFTGFKLKNSAIQAAKHVELSEITAAMKADEVAMQTVSMYYSLFKAEETLKVLTENTKRADQRIRDFSNFVNNGLLAENDLLKAKLQKSNVQLSIEETQNAIENLRFRLNTYLQREPNAPIETGASLLAIQPMTADATDLSNRKDLAVLNKKIELSKVGVELTKANFYPNIAVTGGYIGLQAQNVLSVTNAVNVGVGLKYNISSLYKNKNEVNAAKIQQVQAENLLSISRDNALIENKEARNNYELAVKKQTVYEESLAQATENLRIVTNKNKNGLADTDQLLEADLQQLQALINQKTGKADQQLAWYQLQYTTGSLLDYLQIQQ